MARPDHSLRRPALGLAALALVPLAMIGVFFLLPVGGMVARGFWPDGRLDPGGVLDVFGRSRTRSVLLFTLWSAGSATVVSVLLGVPTAYALHRLRFRGRTVLRAIVMIPFVLPTVVVGVAFRQLVSESGPLSFLRLDGTAGAIILALAFFNVAVVVRTVGSFWEAIDTRQEQAAAALGASPVQVLRTVTLPALLPGIVSAASVVFLFCATSFGVVLTMGGLRYANVETEIYLLTTQELDLSAAAALSVLQILVIVTLLVIAARTRRDVPPVSRSSEAGQAVHRKHLPFLLYAGCVVAFLLAPLVSLVVASLRVGERWGLDNYRALNTVGERNALLVPAIDALGNSLLIALAAALIALVLGLIVAFLVSRQPRSSTERRIASVFDGIFMLPLGVSAVTLGFGFLITLNRPPLDLRTSIVLVPIAQAMVALPLVVRTVAPILRSIDPRQRQAAASLGAGGLRVLISVDLPIARRSVLAATGFAFAVSLGEFGATNFLTRSDRPTLPVVIYQLISHPGQLNYGMAMAASVLLAATTALVMLVVELLRIGSVGAF